MMATSDRQRHYVQAAIQAEYDALISTGEGNRNNQLNLGSYSLGQLVGAGLLERLEVVELLTQAAREIGLRPGEIGSTIRSGLDAGIKEPRQLPFEVNGAVPLTERRSEPFERLPKPCDAIPLPQDVIAAHLQAVEATQSTPFALRARGFRLEHCKRLQIAADGYDAVFPLYGPTGDALNLKARRMEAEPKYLVLHPEHGGPAWCSPGFADADTVLVGEGELNGMALWLAFEGEYGVMGAGGTNGGLHLSALAGKRVYVFADDDEAGRKALARWGEEALWTGAREVWALASTPADACEIFREGAAALRESYERRIEEAVRVEGEVPSALPLPQVQRDKNGKAEKLKPSALRDLVLETWQVQGTFVRYVAEWDNWYVYDGGVYKLVLDKEMRRRVDLILEAQEQDLSEHALSGVLAKIQRSVSVFIERGPKPAAYLNLKNGLLDVETQILSPHSSDVFSVTQTNTVYDEKASCPKFMTFIERVCPDPMNRLVLQEFLGYILSPRHNLQKALYLEGEAGTGKGTLTTDVMAALLGDVDTDYSLVSTMSLGALQDGEHTLVNAVNKRLIIVSETERNDSLLGFKKITGGDPMLVNPKNKTPYSARIEAKIIITTNEPIFTGSDATNSSIDRRLIILPFNVKQRPEDKNPNIGKELTTPEELSGVLNWCLEGYQRLKANGFMFSSDGDKEHRIEFLSSSNPVIDFLREDATPVEGAQIGSTELYNAWVDWAAGVDNGYGRKGGAGHLPTSQKKFAKKFEAAAAALGWEVEKSRDSVTRRYIWQGVALRKL